MNRTIRLFGSFAGHPGLLAVFAVSVWACSPCRANNYYWRNASGGSWTNVHNWATYDYGYWAPSPPPSGIGDVYIGSANSYPVDSFSTGYDRVSTWPTPQNYVVTLDTDIGYGDVLDVFIGGFDQVNLQIPDARNISITRGFVLGSGSSVTLGAGALLSVETVRAYGSLTLDSGWQVGGDVTAGGFLTVSGTVGGSVTAGGDLTIATGGTVKGYGLTVGGQLVIANGAQISATQLTLNGNGFWSPATGAAWLPKAVTLKGKSSLALASNFAWLVPNGVGIYENGTLTVENGASLSGHVDMGLGKGYQSSLVVAGGELDTDSQSDLVNLTVAFDGVLNANGWLAMGGASINAGTMNLLGSSGILSLSAGSPSPTASTLLNQPSGLIKLLQSTLGGISADDASALINQGGITKEPGSAAHIEISVPHFDNSQGAVFNASGTLSLTFNGPLAGDYYTAQGATTELSGTLTKSLLNLNGVGRYQFKSGTLTLPVDVPPNLKLIGGTLLLGPGFQGVAIQDLTLDGINLAAPATVSGKLTLNSGTISAPITVASGGRLTMNGGTISSDVTVASGGLLTMNGGTISSDVTVASGSQLAMNDGTLSGKCTIAEGGLLRGVRAPASLGGLTLSPGGLLAVSGRVELANGGVLNGTCLVTNKGTLVSTGGALQIGQHGLLVVDRAGSVNLGDGQLFADGPCTNWGTFNLTNAQITVFNDGNFWAGGFVNQYSGSIRFQPSAGAGPNFNSISGFGGHDYLINLGSISQWSGSYATISFQAIFDNSVGVVSALNGPLNLTFNGTLTGYYSAWSGSVVSFSTPFLPTSSASSLTPDRFLFLRGPGQFQFTQGTLILPSDVVPNLALSGGTVLLGPGFQGGTIQSLLLNGATLGTPLVITGVLAGRGSLTNGTYTVASGAIMSGSFSLYAGTSLDVATGGVLNLDGDLLALNGPCNNAGTINFSSYGIISISNDGQPSAQGGLVNLPGGSIQIWGSGLITGSGGQDYLRNQGAITQEPGSSGSYFAVSTIDNQGTMDVQHGVMSIHSSLTLEPSGALNVGINNTNDFGVISFTGTNPLGLAGAFSANLNRGYQPLANQSLTVLTFGSSSGKFANTNLPSPGWLTTYGLTNFVLTADAGTVVAPTIVAPRATISLSAKGKGGQWVSFAASASGSPGPIVTYQFGGATITSPFFFPVGSNRVTCVAVNPAASVSASFDVVVLDSQPPLPGAAQVSTVVDTAASLRVQTLLATARSQRASPLSIIDLASTSSQGGLVRWAGDVIHYLPPSGYIGRDLLNYTLSDGYGTAKGMILVTIAPAGPIPPAQDMVAIALSSGNAVNLQFTGLPGLPYVIQAAASPIGPWADLSGMLTPGASGLVSFTDSNPTSPKFYRMRAGP